MWTYEQGTGKLIRPDGTLCATGYAGVGAGWNNHLMQDVKNVGPLPCGMYTVGNLEPSHGALGVFVMFLKPDATNAMFGRSAFYCHGRKSPSDLSASHGCIVQDRPARLELAASKDKRLKVVP